MKLFYLFITALVVGCAGGMEVREDLSPSPLDLNYHSALIEACGNINQGQASCSFGHDEIPTGKLTVHTPLGGAIRIFSRECGFDRPFYAKKWGSYSWDLAEMIPLGVKFCEFSILVNWELPEGVESDYPLRGVSGRLYVRRRPKNSSPAIMQWAPNVGITNTFLGASYAQFRAMSTDVVHPVNPSPSGLKYEKPEPVSEPIILNILLSSPVEGEGLYKLWGCGNGVEETKLESGVGSIEIKRDTILGASPKQGSCTLFGWAVDSDKLQDDFTVSVGVFGWKHVHLAANAWIEGEGDSRKLCFASEPTVSVTVYADKVSNALEGCFDFVSDKDSLLGFFTHVGRARYAMVTKEGEIKWAQ